MYDMISNVPLAEADSWKQGSRVPQEPDDYLEKSVGRQVRFALRSPNRPKDLQTSSTEFSPDDLACNPNPVRAVTSIFHADIRDIVPPIHNPAALDENAKERRILTPTAEWEGFVERVREVDFYVKMINLESRSPLPTDHATFSIDDVSENDRHLLKPGAIVRWIIGRERLPNGQIRKVSELYFRMLPAHTRTDYRRALNKVNELLEDTVWDDDSQAG